MEAVFWVHQNENALVIVQSASNLLVILYAINYLMTKKGCYLAAFFIDEYISNSTYANILTEPQYYLMIASIYCCIYWYIESKNNELKTLVGYGILILFYVGMMIDAQYSNESQTFMYNYYVHIVITIHLYIIATLVRWQLLRKRMGEFVNRLLAVYSHSYSITFFCYNIVKYKTNSTKICRIQKV